MRILREKRLSDPIQLPAEAVSLPTNGRKRELAALIQAALKVGADLSARDAGRRAFAELLKLDRDLQPAPAVTLAPAGQVMFAAPKRRRMRATA